MENESQDGTFKRELGLLDATMLLAGSMIGSGIFIVSADIVRQVGSAGWLIMIWVLTGLFTVIAAVSYGELSAMFPKAGGQYVYLKEAYNKPVAFLYGWSFFSVIQTGSIAAVGVAFSKFAAYLYAPLSDANVIWQLQIEASKYFTLNSAQIVSIVTIVFLTYLNSRGIKNSKNLQNFLTTIKVLSLVGLIILGFAQGAKAEIWNVNWLDAWTLKSMNVENGSWMTIGGSVVFSAITASLVGSLFSSDAWNGVTFIAGEIKKPERNVGLSLLLGTSIVSVIYALANLMYLAVIPMNDIANAESDRVAVVAAQNIFGHTGTIIISLMIMISTFACNNGMIMAGPRVYYIMAKDDLFFKKAGRLNKAGVPAWASWIQCLWASVLCLTGEYATLLDFLMIIVIFFHVLTIAGIFILRRKLPDAERPYRAFGYPVLPFLYIIFSTIFCVSLFITKMSTCRWGVVIMLAGIPLYYIIKKKDAICDSPTK